MPIDDNVTELHDVAVALLQLHSGGRGPPAATNEHRHSPPDHNMDIKSAATLFLGCVAASNIPVKNGQSSVSGLKKTREQGTQTDEYDMPCSYTLKLYERIHSLEDQLQKLQIQRSSPLTSNRSNSKKSRKCIARFPNTTSPSAIENDASDGEWQPEEHKSSRQIFRATPQNKINDMVPIGEGYAAVPKRLLKQIDWSSYTGATRKLLTAVFSRRVLATHSLTGKPSPAFPGKPAKKRLDSELVNDIIQIVVERCGVPESVVRTSITTKCADECKMFRSRQQKKKNSHYFKNDQENVPPPPYEDSSDE